MTRRTLLLLTAAAAVRGQKRVAVIAHRGEHLKNPENTLLSIQSSIDLGCDYVEVDVRTTRDGALVLMHDSTVDSKTNGKGKVVELSFDDIRKLDAGRGTRVPTFDEALAIMRGRINVYVDAKAVTAEAMLAALKRHDMAQHAVIYGGAKLFDDTVRLDPKARVMPEAGSVDRLMQSLERWKLHVVAFDRNDFTDPVLEVARAAGVDIFVDRLGKEDTEAHWADAVKRGATGIQTDHPAELIAFLKQAGLR